MAAAMRAHSVGDMATSVRPHRRSIPTSRPARALGAGGRQIILFVLAYAVYFGVRAVTEGSAHAAAASALELVGFERDVGIAWEGALQEAVVQSRLLMEAAGR